MSLETSTRLLEIQLFELERPGSQLDHQTLPLEVEQTIELVAADLLAHQEAVGAAVARASDDHFRPGVLHRLVSVEIALIMAIGSEHPIRIQNRYEAYQLISELLISFRLLREIECEVASPTTLSRNLQQSWQIEISLSTAERRLLTALRGAYFPTVDTTKTRDQEHG